MNVDRAWCNEMTAMITSDELAKDVSSAEALLNRHKEHKAEIDTRQKDFSKFTQRGKALIADKHFLSSEVGYITAFQTSDSWCSHYDTYMFSVTCLFYFFFDINLLYSK